MSVYVYASVCDFVCIALLLSYVLGSHLSVFFLLFFLFFSIVFSTCYHWWICFLVWLLSYFFFFLLLKKIFLIIIFYFFILISLFYFTLYYFILYYLLLSFFFSPFYSEPCGWQALGAPARCQGCASEVGEPSSGHWSTRDHRTPHNNIKRRKSPRDLHLNCKTQLHLMTSKLQCWTPYAKQLARQEHDHIH